MTVEAQGSKKACIGLLAGMLLLAFAGMLVITTPSSLVTEGGRRLQAWHDEWPPAPKAKQQQQEAAVYGQGTHAYFTALLQVAIGLAFAYFYNKKVVVPVVAKMGGSLKDKNISDTGKDDFATGIWDCFKDQWVFIHGLCCPLVRMAHTNEVAGVMGFWESVGVWTCISLFTGGLGNCCLMVYWRKELKGIMGIEDHLVNDILVTCLCPSLSVCQQGSSVDRLIGYEMTGVMDLEWK